MDEDLAFAGISLTSPELGRRVRFVADDGYVLRGRVFDAATARPRLRVLVSPGTGVPGRFYRHFAAWLASRGATVLTYDYRGIGESRRGSVRNTPHRYLDWATRDYPAALATLEAEAPGVPTLIVGHSFGGQALGLSDATRRADALVFLAAQSGYWRHWEGSGRWRLGALWYLTAPLVTSVLGYTPGRLGTGEDLPPQVMKEWARWCREPGYYTDVVEGAAERLASFAMPRLVVSFSDDGYAPRAAVDALAAWQPGPGLERVHLAPDDLARTRVGHFGYFQRDARHGWSWLARWVEGAVPAAPRPLVGSPGRSAGPHPDHALS
ncbi:MAG: alpha/beta fold hydrolase [Myxococcales bacterium]|nr:alpha/beta fold hydrolase [Myxococcales bacterium]